MKVWKTIWKSVTWFFTTYKHGFIALYMLLYMPCFLWLNKTTTSGYHVIHLAIDDYIPFVEFFVVPYLLWFVYVAVAMLYMGFTNARDFKKMCMFLFTGMTIFLFVSWIYPNGHYLRPSVFPRENVFTDLVRMIYKTDTPMNIFPSIHTYNAIGVHIAIAHNERLKKIKWVQWGSRILMVSIVMATVMIKQHSLFDVITGIALAVVIYTLVYGRDMKSYSLKDSWEKFSKRLMI